LRGLPLCAAQRVEVVGEAGLLLERVELLLREECGNYGAHSMPPIASADSNWATLSCAVSVAGTNPSRILPINFRFTQSEAPEEFTSWAIAHSVNVQSRPVFVMPQSVNHLHTGCQPKLIF